MRHILLVIRNGAFAAAIAVGLAFGATEALSGTPDAAFLRPPCTFPDYCDEDWECDDICYPPYPDGGTCIQSQHCCICFER